MYKFAYFLCGASLGALATFLWMFANDPYQKCKRMYVTAEDMSECLWLLENQPALR